MSGYFNNFLEMVLCQILNRKFAGIAEKFLKANPAKCFALNVVVSTSPPPLLVNAKQEEVKNYIREHNGVSKHELIKKFGVSKKFLNQMANTGVFGGEMRSHGYPCQNCGKLITRGVYCHDCFISMRTEMKNRSERDSLLKKDVQEKRTEIKDEHIMLIVDPDETNLGIMKFILSKEFFNYTVLTASSLLSAMNILRNKKISLMLLDDTETSAFDGFEILRRVRTEIEFKNVPVIMMSSKIVKEKKFL